MRKLLGCFLLSLMAGMPLWVNCQANYGNAICLNKKTYALVKDAVDDLQFQLRKSTGTDFRIAKDSVLPACIQLVKLNRDSDSNFDKRLDAKIDDEVLVWSDGKSLLKITAFSKQGLVNGIYSFLDTLGFRWYHPGEEWAYAPKLPDVRMKLDQVFVPAFELRTFFGTFGYPRNPVVGKNCVISNEWVLWSMRTRLGGGYFFRGHAWDEIINRNIKELREHPDYMALVKGERMLPKWEKKFCVSNKGLQEMFVRDRVAALKTEMEKQPGQSAYCISVEPSDGYGDCECDECQKMGSNSTRVFFLANLVAKEFQKISDKAYVSLLAYNTHAAPPDLELEPNVLVLVTPYKYQEYAKPTDMIEQWEKKTHNLFMYDYYGLPIINVDMPLKGSFTPENYAKRIQYWHQQHFKGVTLESSYSIAATGVGLYLLTRLGWDINVEPEKILKEYYNRCYGKNGGVVQEVQKVLEADTLSNEAALEKAMQLLQKKTAKVRVDSIQNTCLADYKAYLHYLKLLYDVQHTDAKADTVAAETLIKFVYDIFCRKMVHPFPINEWLINYSHSSVYIKKYWSTYKPNEPDSHFANAARLTDEEVEKLFKEDCRRLKR